MLDGIPVFYHFKVSANLSPRHRLIQNIAVHSINGCKSATINVELNPVSQTLINILPAF